MPLDNGDVDLRLLESHACQDECTGCPFRGPKVGSKGNPRAPLVFVAESPGQTEVYLGKPLAGPSGKIFHNFVPEGDDANYYVLNALECSPPRKRKDEKTLNQAAMACRDRLLQKIQMHPRRLIVAMGNPAVRSLTGNWGAKITQIRGRLIPSTLSELGILPMVHIAALMRGTGSFRQWKEDIQYALDLGAGGCPKQHIPADVQIISPFIPQAGIDWLFEQMLWPLTDPEDMRKYGPVELTGDIETSGFDHIRDHILSIGITPANDTSISYCFYPYHFPLIKKWLESPHIKWCWHNGKFDVKFLHQAGINARTDDDTMLMSYCLDEVGGVHDLETVSQDVLDAPDYKYMIKPYLPNSKTSYEVIPKNVLARYQAIDTANTAQIRPILRQRIKRDPALEKLYTQTLIPASEMITWVEENGIQTDPERLQENHDYYQEQLSSLSGEINEMLPQSINPGSPQQVSKALFGWLKMPDYSKGSTAEAVILKLQEKTEHPILELILQHRTAVKMYGTYVKGIENKVLNDRIYASYLIHGTRTGRLSSKKPNMQNVPRDAQIRGTFIAAPGYELVEVDLSQAELRCLTVLSGDPILMEIYLTGGDLHTDLANYLFPGWSEREAAGDAGDKTMKALAKEQRVICKNINFGIMFGISKFGLQAQTKKSLRECADLLEGWYDRYHVAGSFIQKCRDAPLNNQVITTCFGRKKRVELVTRDNIGFLQREAANFPPQSISSDITLHAGMRTWRTLRGWGVRIVNLVHDSIIMEVPITPNNELRTQVIQLVATELRQVPIDWGLKRVPFEADAEYGHRWGSLDKYMGPKYEEAA